MTVAYFEESPGDWEAEQRKRRSREMTVIAQDPSLVDDSGRPLVAQVRVPADNLAPGPHDHRFQVVDYDATTRQLLAQVDLTDPTVAGRDRSWSYVDRFKDVDPNDLVGSADFHAQNVYAIAARTLAAFEYALGRRLPWAFAGHELYIVPHAFAEANAYYSPDDCALLFGYLPLPDGQQAVYTCLSHDVVAHETTHAVLDGLRPRFMKPGLPDQAAFHEAFADIVALLSVFAIPELVEQQLGEGELRDRVPAANLTEEAFRRSALFQLAEQIGRALSQNRGSALRRSLELKPNKEWPERLEFEEPHRRGEVLVAAVMRTLAAIWSKRVQDLVHAGTLNRRRAAEEGAKSAQHLLQMAIRAIDYAPSIEFEFEDFLDAILVSDAIIAPDDEHEYRETLRDSFADWGITQPAEQTVNLAETPLRYRNLNYVSLRADLDEVFWFISQNTEALKIDRSYYLHVDSVQPSVRVGPDGLVINEVVATYVQALDATAAELKERGVSTDLKDDTEVQIWGGGTLIFDQFGAAKLHERKPIDDWDRQTRRLDYLVRHGFYDTRRRLGFSYGTGAAFRFADFHVPDLLAGEEW